MRKQLGIERVEILKGILPDNLQISYDTEGETETSHEITYIDIPKNQIHYRYYVTHECGCCGGFEDEFEELDGYLGYLSQADFDGLVKNIEYNANRNK